MDGYNFPRHALLCALILFSLPAAAACNVLGEQDDGPAPAATAAGPTATAEPTATATETAPPSATATPPPPTATPTPTTTLAPTPTLPPPTPEIRGEPVIPVESPFVDGTDDLLPDVVNVHYGVDFADVDGDGSLDIWVADCGRVGDQLLLNEGDGRLADVTDERLSRPGAFDHWERTSFGEDVVFVDVDGDGDADAYVNSSPHSPAGNVWSEALFINDGSGRFVDEIESRLPTDVFWQQGISGLAAFGDVNGDGHVDLVRTTRFQSKTSPDQNGRTGLFLNDGAGFFTDATDRLPDDGGTHTSGLGLADVNLDGHLDIVLANNPESVSEMRIYLNDGSGRFRDASTELLPAAWRQGLNVAKFALGDVDDDGDTDIVSSNVILRYEQASGRFVADDRTPVVNGAGLAIVGDVNGDGFLDVIATQFREVEGEGTHHPVLLLNDGQGGFGPAQTIAEMPPGTIIQDMGLADVDGDGDADLYVGTGVPPHEGEEGMVGGTQKDNLFVNTLVHPEVSQ